MRGRVLGALRAVATAAVAAFRGSARQQAVQHQPPAPAIEAKAAKAARSSYTPIQPQPVRRKRAPRLYVAGRYRDDGFDGVRLDRARAKRARRGARRLDEKAFGGWR